MPGHHQLFTSGEVAGKFACERAFKKLGIFWYFLISIVILEYIDVYISWLAKPQVWNLTFSCHRMNEFLNKASKTFFEKLNGQVEVKNLQIWCRADGRFFFVICYFLLHAFFTHYYLPPGAGRSNISKTKHQILIKHKFV